MAFSVNAARLGRNYFTSEDVLVGHPVLLTPGDQVQKAGRTTGVTVGTISQAIVQIWADGRLSSEIAVVGKNRSIFADSGDAGALCVVEGPTGEMYAGGMVVGKNSRYSLAVVTPMWAVIKDLERVLGEKVKFM